LSGGVGPCAAQSNAQIDTEIAEKGGFRTETSQGSGSKCGSLPEITRTVYNPSKYKGFLKMDFVKDLWGFLKVRKKFWLLPIILVLMLFGVLIVLTAGSAIAPFIYAVF
jgi:hypothetical protein